MIARFTWGASPRPRFEWASQPTDRAQLLLQPERLAAIVGPKGDPGGATTTRTASVALSGHRVVRDGVSGAAYASADEAAHADAILGVTTAAAGEGQSIEIAVSDRIEESSWSWAEGPVFLGLDGHLIQPAPEGVAFVRQIGRAIAPDILLITPRPPVFT